MKLTAKSLLVFWFGTIVSHGQIWNFQHIVVIVQENRTPDNLFQGLCISPTALQRPCSTTPSSSQYNIQTNNWLDKKSSTGTTQPTPARLANSYDLSHAHSAFVKMCDAYPGTGVYRMDGAGISPASPHAP